MRAPVRFRRVLFTLFLTLGLCGGLWAGAPQPPAGADRADLVLVRHSERVDLEAARLPVIWKGAGFFVGLWDGGQRSAAQAARIPFQTLAPGFDEGRSLYLVESHHDTPPPARWRDRVLWNEGRKWIVEIDAREAGEWPTTEYSLLELPREPRGWPSHAPSVTYDCSYDPLIDGMLQATTEVKWFDWIEKLSGHEPVIVDGTERTIETRYSSYMFSGNPTAKGYDLVLQQAQAWHYGPGRLEEHAYNVSGGLTWKNLVLTIPGTIVPSEQVLITGHLDSTNQSGNSYAPGANDNGTGNATLLEAARLLRRYRFERTVKIVFFTGEEDGLLGSEAYVDDYPTNDILGVVNLDMFGWDGDDDSCFEIHAGTLPQSQDVADCYDASITSYALGLTRDYLTTGATDRSDHASFWQANVGAIEIAENFFFDGLPDGCSGQDDNPGYHTSNDTVTQNLNPPFGFAIGRAGLATIAGMAKPVSACFSGAPALTSVAGVNEVDLSWTPVAGASTYRVYRSTQGCQGQWFEIGETSGTSWLDTTANQAVTYTYQVEAVHADGFCVSAASNCAAAAPTVYHARSVTVGAIDSCALGGSGDGDGVLDPGETALLPVTLQNDGNAGLTQIAGTLSGLGAGVTVTDPSAAWPDIAPGNAESSLPDHFGVAISDTLTCGTELSGTIALAYAEGANDTQLSFPVGNPYEVLLVDEDFSGGIPTSWIVQDNGSGGGSAATWTTENPGNRSIGSPFDSPFAIVDSDEAGSSASQDETLITPSVDAQGCRELYLEFSNQFHQYGSEVADVDVSTDGGLNWSNRLRMEGSDDGYSSPNTKIVDLSAPFGTNLRAVRVRFHYHQASYEWWWAIDNIKLRCMRMDCTPCTAAPSPPGEAGTSAPLRMDRGGSQLFFDWGVPDAGCQAEDYALYRGDLTSLSSTGYSHDQMLSCSTGGTSHSIVDWHPALGIADYFLVVSQSSSQEGSYGEGTLAGERPVSGAACKTTQDLRECGP